MQEGFRIVFKPAALQHSREADCDQLHPSFFLVKMPECNAKVNLMGTEIVSLRCTWDFTSKCQERMDIQQGTRPPPEPETAWFLVANVGISESYHKLG